MRPAMIDVQRILLQLAGLARDAMPVAAVWHLIVAGVLIALLVGWQPRRRVAALLIPSPLLSASLLAWIDGAVVHGTLLLLLFGVLAILALRLERGQDRVQPARPFNGIAGLGLIALGLFYPHYLPRGVSFDYLYAAPTGVVPGASLLLTLGFALLVEGFGSKAWSSTLALGCLLYGAFGAAVLGVRLDLALMLGAVLLGLLVLPSGEPTAERRTSRM